MRHIIEDYNFQEFLVTLDGLFLLDGASGFSMASGFGILMAGTFISNTSLIIYLLTKALVGNCHGVYDR